MAKSRPSALAPAFLVFASVALAIGLAACASDGALVRPIPDPPDPPPGPPDPPPDPPPGPPGPPPDPPWDRPDGPDVYIVGANPSVFKNGVTTPLGDVPIFRAGLSVFVSDGDVYVAGQAAEFIASFGPLGMNVSYAVLWKNGEVQRLGKQTTDTLDNSVANSVYVAGGHVYVAGHERHENPDDDGRKNKMPVLWVDGVPQYLPTHSIYGGEALCVFVSGDDVYVGGFIDWNGYIWKNGVRGNPLFAGGGSTQTHIESVFVDGDDVYAVGYDFVRDSNYIGTTRPIFFKNGVGQALDGYGIASSIFVSDGDVYVGGYESNREPYPGLGVPVFRGWAALWKNGVKHRLTECTDYSSSVNSVHVLDGDVYMVGTEGASPRFINRLWVNGDAFDLGLYGLGASGSTPHSVFVVGKGK